MKARITLSGLIARRARVASELEEASAQVAVLTASLRVIDGRIRRLGANDDPTAIRPARYRLVAQPRERGAIIRPILTILRLAGAPMTAREITLRLMEQRGLDAGDKGTLRNVSHQVKMALHGQRRAGVLAMEMREGTTWKVTE